jgi:hypothetical protein
LHCVHTIVLNDKIIGIVFLHRVVEAAPCPLFLIALVPIVAAVVASMSRLWLYRMATLSAILSLDFE